MDRRLTRTQHRAACSQPEKTLPYFLTNVYNKAWLPDPSSESSPFDFPSAATDEALHQALPNSITSYLCEWDMQLQEALDFYARLKALGKDVRCAVIGEKLHGFDKSPIILSVDPKVT